MAGSKAHRPLHRNPWTGELLENKVQVCSACKRNFGTTEAGDTHRIGEFALNRRCANPADVGLVCVETTLGSMVWRLPE